MADIAARACETCKSLFDNHRMPAMYQELWKETRNDPKFMWQMSAERMQRNITGGCMMCKRILQLFRKRILTSQRFDDNGEISLWCEYWGWPLFVLKTSPYPDDSDGIHKYFAFRLAAASEDDPCAELVIGRPMSRFVPSQNHFNSVRNWARNCSLHHPKCASREPARCPTRLLDLSLENESQNIRVALTEGLTETYAALSYCWGKSNYTTNSGNLQRHMSSLHLLQLPKTIQDAVFCTRHLGIRYLWVDALCIVQDSEEEKAMEMSKMAQIFRNASITISAAVASDASEGFLYPRDVEPPTLDEDIPYLPFRCSENVVGTVGVLEFSISSLRDAINYRGWTLQEQMLSRRLLIYGYVEASWQCLEMEETEISAAASGPHEGWLMDLRQQLHGPGPNGTAFFGNPAQWEKIVQEYSLRKITNSEDKLPALSAITAEFKPPSGHFVAGLWSSWIPRLLLWRVPDPEESARLLDVAPSWSWASLTGRVSFVHDSEQLNGRDARIHGREELIEVLECSATPKYGFAPYGELNESRLVLMGKIRPLDFDIDDAVQERTVYNPLDSWQKPYVDVYVDSTAEFQGLKPPFYSMPVFRITEYIVCLLLHGSAGKFRRVGLHIINYQDSYRSSDLDYSGWPYWPTAYDPIEPTVVELF